MSLHMPLKFGFPLLQTASSHPWRCVLSTKRERLGVAEGGGRGGGAGGEAGLGVAGGRVPIGA